jgi:hypothetical protein
MTLPGKLLTFTTKRPALKKSAGILAFRSPHDIRWDALGPADAPYVREALLEADKRREREKGTLVHGKTSDDAGSLYLEVFSILRLSD